MIKSIYKKIASIIGVLFIVVLLLTVLLSYFKNTYKIEISTNPSDAKVTLFDGDSKINNLNNVKKGTYKLRVEKEGYITDVRDITVNKNLSLTINLISKIKNVSYSKETSTLKDSLYPYSIFPNDISINYNTKTKTLEIKKDDKDIWTDKGNLAYFSIKYPSVSYRTTNSNIVKIFNTQNQGKGEIDTTIIQPVIYTTVNSGSGATYLLGKYDPVSRLSTLYKNDPGSINFVELFPTNANKLDLIHDNLLLLIEERDHLFSNFYNLYQINERRMVIQTENAGYYSISPSREQIAIIKEKTIDIYNTKNFSKHSINWNNNGIITWKDEGSLLLLQSENNEVKYSFIDSTYGNQTETATLDNSKGIVIAEVLSYDKGILYIRTTNGQIVNIKFD